MSLSNDNASTSSKVTLENCEDEPIRIPGLIQSDYLLITYHTRDAIVQHASGNLFEIVGIEPDKLIGSSITDYFDEDLIVRIKDHFQKTQSFFLETNAKLGEEYYPLIAHVSDGIVVMELDLTKEDGIDQEQLLSGYNKILTRLSEEGTLDDTFKAFIDNIKTITGFDRVMLYKFDAFWNGEVIAEAKEPHLEAFLNLNYPHTDIPAQARELYLQNWVRHIADVNYDPIEIFPYSGPNSDQPLNLSMATSRSVSPIHIEYLKNMGVGATMVCSVIIDKKLWGLIACHHYSKKHLDIFTKSTVELLAKTFSHFIRHKLTLAEDDLLIERNNNLNLINEQLIEQWDILGAFSETKKEYILNLMDADGAVLLSEGAEMSWGVVPESSQAQQLYDHLIKKDLDTWSTLSIVRALPEISWDSPIAGVYFLRFTAETEIYIMWFRQERPKTVQWAGNPYFNKQGEKQVLSPRSSFDKWSENMKGISADWTQNDEKAAAQLQGLLKDFAFVKNNELVKKVKQKSVELAEVLDQVLLAKQTADAALKLKQEFLLNMSHEVRTPLNSVVGLTQMIKGKTEDEQIQQWSDYILKSSDRLINTVSSILTAAKNDSKSETVNLESINLSEIIREMANVYAPLFEKQGVTLASNIEGELDISGDKNKISQVLNNLIGNALKFTDAGQVTIGLLSSNHNAIITLEDTGRGMSENYLKDLFKPFSQEDGGINRVNEGSGLGLYISKNYIELMGGLIEVSSIQGKGTSFIITLPLL